MKVILQRTIYFQSRETGLLNSMVSKECNWTIPPVIGAIVDDDAWHRNDVTKIENIVIPADEGDAYYVELNSFSVGSALSVNKQAEIAKSHGWKIEF